MSEKSLYELLGVDKDASQSDIKKAYHKLALQLHPDKNPGDEEAASKFQSLQKIYTILGDPEKRKVYDETGSTDEEDLSDQNFDDLYTYFRAMFKEVTAEDIQDYEAKFRGSKDEQEELLQLYERHKGSMDKVFEWLVCSDPALDSHRFMDAIDAAISKGEAKRYKAYSSWAKQTSAKPRPANPLKPKRPSKKQQGSMTALVAAIKNKGNGSGNILAALEAKYGGGKKRKGREPAAAAAAEAAEPSEEEFEAARKRLDARKGENREPAAAAGSSKRGSKGKRSKS